ncbi:MAG: AAC(3) family N-acetyltransferase [Lachnospiraceae bacterium]|nr:AAC(3) family N-acetyltransferase [Lachnospiraceae bacterium]
MYTKELLIADIAKSGIDPNGTLLVHSSCKSVGACENNGDTILDAFIEYMQNGLLIFPTHTWDTVEWTKFNKDGFPVGKKNIYDPAKMPSCVGILSNLFLRRDGVVRSLHPTHSLAARGKDAVSFTSGEELTASPCPRFGCYGKLYDRKAQVLFMGCDLSKNTYLHGVEEWNEIPERLTDKPQEIFIKLNNELLPCPQYRHYYQNGDVSENYIKAEELFIREGAAAYAQIGDAQSILCDAVKMADLISKYLTIKPDLFADDKPIK